MIAAPRIASAADDLDRRERLAEQHGRERDPDDRLEQHQDARPASRRSRRIPVRNTIDGMAAAKSPVNSEQRQDRRRRGAGTTSARAVAR